MPVVFAMNGRANGVRALRIQMNANIYPEIFFGAGLRLLEPGGGWRVAKEVAHK